MPKFFETHNALKEKEHIWRLNSSEGVRSSGSGSGSDWCRGTEMGYRAVNGKGCFEYYLTRQPPISYTWGVQLSHLNFTLSVTLHTSHPLLPSFLLCYSDVGLFGGQPPLVQCQLIFAA